MASQLFTPRRLALLVAVAALAAVAGIALSPKPGRPREAGRNVLLVTVDTLRADAVGSYGKAGASTPWMDRLAAAGARFSFAHAHNVTTLASHANILSGRLPTEHGVRDNAGFRFPSGTETLATLLKARGYKTAAFVSAFPLDSRFGLARGFDVYDDRFVDAQARPVLFEQERSGPATVALAKSWIEAAQGAPWFCWVHLYEPHAPYAPPEPFASRFASRPYDGEVAAADGALGPLVEPILAAGRDGRTLVVLTADHGESLGEHGEATHGIFAYEATLRVPLLFYSPGARPRVIDAPARHVDVLPTILDALALPVPAGLPGRSLVDAAAGADAGDAPTYFEALSGQLNRGWAPLHGVLENRKKLVELPLPELYDLASDPAEGRNLAASSPEPLERLRARLGALRAGDAGAGPSREEEATLEKLRSLGYVGAATAPRKERYGPEDDPKTLVPVDKELQDVVALFSSGQKEAALDRCRALVRERPGLPLALVYLGQLERDAGNLGASVFALRRALALNPEDTVTATMLAADLAQAGKASEAIALLEPWASRAEPDIDVLLTTALAAARLDRAADAERALERARGLDPSSARVLVGLGSVRLSAGKRDAAREAFEQALVQNPAAAQAQSALAMMAAEDGRADEARERFSRALAADPGEALKLLALASMLASRGRMPEARGYLELFEHNADPARFGRELAQVRAALARGGAAAAAPR